MKIEYFIFIIIISFLSFIIGLKSLRKFNKESENLSEKELFFRGDTKQDIYGLILIGAIGIIGSLIIYIVKF